MLLLFGQLELLIELRGETRGLQLVLGWKEVGGVLGLRAYQLHAEVAASTGFVTNGLLHRLLIVETFALGEVVLKRHGAVETVGLVGWAVVVHGIGHHGRCSASGDS